MENVNKAIKFLKSDPVMKRLIESHNNKPKKITRKDPFKALCRSIVSQQLATKAAETIYKRFIALYGNKNPTPEQILVTRTQKLRKCGLSGQKSEYLKDLSRKVLDGTVEIKRMNKLSDQEIIDELVKVKGIGVWTAQMFLMFNMGRPDVFPVGDLAIQNMMRELYRLSPAWKVEHLEEIAEKWKPYRSIACWYIWHYKDSKQA